MKKALQVLTAAGVLACILSMGADAAGLDDVIDSIRLVNNVGWDNTEDSDSSALFEKAGNGLFSFEIPSGWTTRTDGDAVLAVKDEEEVIPYLKAWTLTPSGTTGEEVVKWKNEFQETYQNRLAGEPEIFIYEMEGTDRAAAGIRALVSSVDGMDTITYIRAIEDMDGQYLAYECAYISSIYAEDKYEDETTYFEFLHMVDTMAVMAETAPAEGNKNPGLSVKVKEGAPVDALQGAGQADVGNDNGS